MGQPGKDFAQAGSPLGALRTPWLPPLSPAWPGAGRPGAAWPKLTLRRYTAQERPRRCPRDRLRRAVLDFPNSSPVPAVAFVTPQLSLGETGLTLSPPWLTFSLTAVPDDFSTRMIPRALGHSSLPWVVFTVLGAPPWVPLGTPPHLDFTLGDNMSSPAPSFCLWSPGPDDLGFLSAITASPASRWLGGLGLDREFYFYICRVFFLLVTKTGVFTAFVPVRGRWEGTAQQPHSSGLHQCPQGQSPLASSPWQEPLGSGPQWCGGGTRSCPGTLGLERPQPAGGGGGV